AHACAPLNLQRVAARNVDAARAEIQIVACQRRNENGPVFVCENRAARGKLMRDVPGAEPLASGQYGKSTRQVKTVRANHVKTTLAPSQACRLNIKVSQSETINARLGLILDVDAQPRYRRCSRYGEN